MQELCPAAIYIANHAFINTLCEEIGEVTCIIEDMVFATELKPAICFAQDIWLDPIMIRFQSISEAAAILRKAGRFWYLHPVAQVRRARLIEAQLRQVASLDRDFPITKEIPTIGGFTLLDKNTLVYSAKRQKKWPDGRCLFIEDKINPPNRAYLKLWEALSLLKTYPKPGETALDLGASPGGWTFVMQSLGTQITAIDKAPLAPSIMKRPRVQFLQQSAFALDPTTLTHTYDWVLSDIACYPDRAYSLIMKWITSGKAKQMIFTIKLQGDASLENLKPFKAIPNSSLIHLFYNKHEATFFYPALESA